MFPCFSYILCSIVQVDDCGEKTLQLTKGVMSSAPYRPTKDVENWHFILKWNHLCFYSEDQAEVISKMSGKFLV